MCLKGPVTLPELLEAYWVLPELVVLYVWQAKYRINTVEENTVESALLMLVSLVQEDEVVHVGAGFPKGPLLQCLMQNVVCS